jgi:hypothetical protein
MKEIMFHRRACSRACPERLAACWPNPFTTDTAAVAENRRPNIYECKFFAVSLFLYEEKEKDYLKIESMGNSMQLTIENAINQSSSPKLRSIRCRTHRRVTTNTRASAVSDHITANTVGPFPSMDTVSGIEVRPELGGRRLSGNWQRQT